MRQRGPAINSLDSPLQMFDGRHRAICGILMHFALWCDAGDIGPLMNGVLAGAVSITAGCAVVQAYGAFIIGLIAAFVYTFSSVLLIK